MNWYIPTFWGDINLIRKDKDRTVVEFEKVTANEEKALNRLAVVGEDKGWHDGTLRNWRDGGNFTLEASIGKVQKILTKALKPGCTIVSAVKFGNGQVSEIREEEPVEKARAATSVAAPTRGCPAPDFEQADHRATRVLETFLTPEQLEDFRKHNRFVTRGADTGHRYMVTSRDARDSLATYHRSLFDLDAKMPFCVHDWMVPAAEEMLALHLFLTLPGRERYLREIPEA